MSAFQFRVFFVLFLLLCAPLMVRAADVTVPTTGITITASGTATYDANNYSFVNGGVLNVNANGTDVSASKITLSGTISSQTGALGTINIYGNKGKSTTSNGLFFTGNASNFAGKIVIGNATRTEAAASRDWFVPSASSASMGKTEFILQTRTNSGILFNDSATLTLGALSGSGLVRSEGAPTFQIGSLRTQSTQVDVFHGVITHPWDGTINTITLTKQGAGTLILSGKLLSDSVKASFACRNSFKAVNVTAGTLQFGDFGNVYGANDLYYAQNAVGTGDLTSAQLTTLLRTVAAVTVTDGTLAFGLSTSQTVANAMTLTNGTLSNMNPDATITFSGKLTGTMNVGGKGTVTIPAANVNEGLTSITVNGGTLRLNGATTIPTTATLKANGGTLLFATNGPYTNTITGAGGTIAVANGNSTTLSGTVTGTMSVAGPGTLTLSNVASQVTATVKTGATLVLNGTTAGKSALTLDGGTLNPNGNVAGMKVSSNGGTLQYGSMNVLGLSDVDPTHPGTLTILRNGNPSHYLEGCNLGDLNSATYDFSNLKATIKVAGNSIVSLGASRNFQNTVFQLATNNTKDAALHLARNPGEFVWGDLTGDGLVMTSKNSGISTPTGAYRVSVGSLNHDSTFNGAFANNTTDDGVLVPTSIDLTKVGTGTWTLGAAAAGTVWDCDNVIRDLTISGGELVLARNAGKVTAKNVTAKNGTTLTFGADGQKISETLTMMNGSTLNVLLDDENSGALMVKNLNFESGAALTFTTSDDFYDNLTSGMTLDFLTVEGTNSGLTADLFASSVAADPMLSKYFLPVWTSGGLSLQMNDSAIPEPAAWVMLTLGLGLIGWRRKALRK